ncbi:anoctamin-10 isoform X2 [Zootermopsis nevadensis]|nr:anoctamin-10 isoform X2 [Zootermopsis nevadensis]XP_021939126.1 anoctamin-10 isoform X2 [Zootermopsis nevadensis]XP_021939127.1 anoctamin-10 isoform X2 [Zootermopsis nevadensis]
MHVDDLLTTAERQYIVRHELENIRTLKEDDQVPGYPAFRLYEGQSIVQMCLHWKLVKRMYPLHDMEALDKLGKKWYWALFQKQPFEDIRLYFGEAVALYFTFLGFYTTALLVPMFLGFLQLFLPTESIAFFCVFNVLWMTVFLEVWKRKCSELAFTWGTIGMTSLDEPRANYRGVMGIDEVTGRYQPQFPRWKTNARLYCVSLPIVFVCMVGAFFVMLASFWAEELLLNMKKQQSLEAGEIVVLLPSIIYSAVVFIMNSCYRKVATWLTEWENHRTQSQFDRHRVTKLVLFEFVNNFMSLFYIAFYVQDMDMLKNQLAVMLLIFQAINNFQEAILPLLIKYYNKRVTKALKFDAILGNKKTDESGRKKKSLSVNHEPSRAILDYIPELDSDDPRIELAICEGEMEDYEGTYDDYLEMFIQFGYVFLFSSVYPMAAFWAVANNIMEIRADAFKLCRLYRRPVAKRVKDTGAWQRAFEIVGAMSIMTNCSLLCMSPQLRRLAPTMTSVEWVLVFVVLEHMLLGIRHFLHLVIPDRPEWVRVALARINHLSKRALKNERMLKSRRHILRRYKTVHGSHNYNS